MGSVTSPYVYKKETTSTMCLWTAKTHVEREKKRRNSRRKRKKDEGRGCGIEEKEVRYIVRGKGLKVYIDRVEAAAQEN